MNDTLKDVMEYIEVRRDVNEQDDKPQPTAIETITEVSLVYLTPRQILRVLWLSLIVLWKLRRIEKNPFVRAIIIAQGKRF